jgi:hypothetical protein
VEEERKGEKRMMRLKMRTEERRERTGRDEMGRGEDGETGRERERRGIVYTGSINNI